MSSSNSDALYDRYQRAFCLEQGKSCSKSDKNGEKIAINTTVYPYWISGSHCFWYERETLIGKEYRLVDAKKRSNDSAFNHKNLAKLLSEQSVQPVSAENLPLSQVEITLAPRHVSFAAFGKCWRYDDEQMLLAVLEQEGEQWPGQKWQVSPDGTKAAFVRDCNLWVKDLASGEEQALTSDGEKFYAYAATATVYGRPERHSVEAVWSADSQRLLTLIRDTREVEIAPPLVQYLPTDGSLRPTILNPDRRVGLRGDTHIEVYRFISIHVSSGHVQHADYRSCPVFMPPYIGYFTGGRGWWSKDNRHAYFIDLARGGRTARLLVFDTDTGDTRVLIEETETYRFSFIPMSHFGPLMLPLPESDEVIWYSERSGWAHLYLYDAISGELKHPITLAASSLDNEWVVRFVLHYDAARRELWIQTAGRDTQKNPYYCDICRINIDTGKLTPVITSDDDYVVCEKQSRVGKQLLKGAGYSKGISPCGDYAVTTRSRVDAMPVSFLLDRDGQVLMTLEKASAPGLPEGWQWPEPIMLKAADGITDIYAVVFRPSNFSPDKTYPVLDCSWGDFIPTGSFTNSMGKSGFYQTAAAYAELGFIAVMILSRGTCMRSKAFYDDKSYSLLFSYHLDDHVAALKQLAEQFPYMDLTKVGAASPSSSVAPVVGLLHYPDFYKVGVSNNMFSDLSLLGEFYGDHTGAGLPPEKINAQRLELLVDRLQGKLLMIHGMLDNCTPVASVFRLVEALQKANKHFDMLILPSLGHGRSNYTVRRTYDYLVKHLLGTEPPKEFDYSFPSNDSKPMIDGLNNEVNVKKIHSNIG